MTREEIQQFCIGLLERSSSRNYAKYFSKETEIIDHLRQIYGDRPVIELFYLGHYAVDENDIKRECGEWHQRMVGR